MFVHFNEDVRKILKEAKIEMQNLRHPFIGSEHVLLSILNGNNIISTKLKKYQVDYNIFKNELIKKVGYGNSVNNYLIYTPLLKRILENAIIDAKESDLNEVDVNVLFSAILEEGEGVAIRILISLGVDIDKMYSEINNSYNVKSINKKLLVNECGIDLTKKCEEEKTDPLIGREKEVHEIINILLRRNKNNPLLIGEAGVGKTAIIEELAKRIVNGDVPEKLKNKRIISLSMASCVAGTKYRGEFEERITKMLKELEKNDDIIVFIDEIHTLVGAGGAEGAIDASNIIKPSLARGNIKIIGATTIKEYKETISKDKALNRRFQTVFINENTKKETIDILLKLKKIYEDYHNVIIKDEIIEEIVNLTDRYIGDRSNPDKSIDILDMVCTNVFLKKTKKSLEYDKLKKDLANIKKEKSELIVNHLFSKASMLKKEEMSLEDKINELSLLINEEKRKVIKLSDVKEIIESKTKIPIFEFHDNKKMLNIDKYLKKKIIGQDEIINKVSKATKKIMLGLKDDLPYSFLFVGKSGVGKTMLVKEYCNYLKIPLIRLDMTEYREAHSISKIIGSPPGYVGYNDVDTVLERIKNNPYCVLLLDEIEKSCQEVVNLFLQVLDEGIITDSHDNKVSLKNTIIIMTSNIASDKEHIGFTKEKDSDESIRHTLSIPFVNRINTICYFNSLSKENVLLILKLRIKLLQKKYDKYHIKINLSDKEIDDIIIKSEYEIYGVRKALKILDEKVDDYIIDAFYKKNNCVKN